MDDFVPPPFGLSSGSAMPRTDLVGAFATGNRLAHCTTLRIEDVMLITNAGAVTALRLRPAVLLVRAPGVLDDVAADIRTELGQAGLFLQREDPPLADVVALMLSGLRGTPWDLWGPEGDTAVRGLEDAAAGDVAVDLGAVATRLRTDLVLADYEEELMGRPASEEQGPAP